MRPVSLTEKEAAHSASVRRMFAGIARRYDLLNHVLSLNIDKLWRRAVSRRLADILSRPDAAVLDVACGTGDLALQLNSSGPAAISGLDFCRPMLDIAAEKSARSGVDLPWIEGDAMALPFPDAAFDAVTIAFGLRNLPNVPKGLNELVRTIKPGGRLVILEFSTPWIPGIKQLFGLYFTKVLPRIGGSISGSRGAYEYLPDSVAKFPDQAGLSLLLAEAGLEDITYKNLSGGIAAIHEGKKPQGLLN